MAKLESSKTLTAKHLRLVIYGPPKMGKTTKAVSISEKTDGNLDDLVVVNFDGNGTSCLASQGLTTNVFDLSMCASAEALKKEMVDIFAQLPELIKKGVKAIIFDTISSYNDALEASLSKTHTGYDIYRARMNRNEELALACLALPIHTVFVSHSKLLKEGDAETAKRAATFMGTARIAMDVGGQAADPYKRHCDLLAAMPEPKLNKGVLERFLYCKPGSHGYEVGSKYASLEEKEYGSLQDIVKKMRA